MAIRRLRATKLGHHERPNQHCLKLYFDAHSCNLDQRKIFFNINSLNIMSII